MSSTMPVDPQGAATAAGQDDLVALDAVIDGAVAPHAVEVDRTGMFPSTAVQALGQAGLLGLVSANEVGGRGAGLGEAAAVIERLAGACGSTAMVVLMHYAAAAIIEAHSPEEVRREIAAGRHLTKLAFSEAGSRQWGPGWRKSGRSWQAWEQAPLGLRRQLAAACRRGDRRQRR